MASLLRAYSRRTRREPSRARPLRAPPHERQAREAEADQQRGGGLGHRQLGAQDAGRARRVASRAAREAAHGVEYRDRRVVRGEDHVGDDEAPRLTRLEDLVLPLSPSRLSLLPVTVTVPSILKAS